MGGKTLKKITRLFMDVEWKTVINSLLSFFFKYSRVQLMINQLIPISTQKQKLLSFTRSKRTKSAKVDVKTLLNKLNVWINSL